MKNKKQSGFSLLEVLIAWAILSVVLLGLLDYQLQGLRSMRDSKHQTKLAINFQSSYELAYTSVRHKGD